MRNDMKKILLTEEQIEKKVTELAKRITEDYAGKKLLAVVILKGSFIFAADLIRKIDLPVEVDFMVVSSYGSGTETSGIVKIIKDLNESIAEKDVLIIEDIMDSGVTLSNLVEVLKTRQPSSMEICALLNKPERRKAEVDVKYIGYDIPDEFIVGYGLDFSEKYRNLPYIGVIKEELYK
jgi:hypoxanthine phosphoribosyltransferase